LDTQEAVLGECTFGGANGHQIGKIHLGWEVDIQGFPTSQPELSLDVGKCFKISLKGALRVEITTLRVEVFDPVFIFQLRKRSQFD